MSTDISTLIAASIKRLQRTMKFLTVTFVITYSILGLIIISSGNQVGKDIRNLALLLVILVPFSFVAFYILLGIQASRLNKSVVLWVGLSILTSPIGPIIFYFFARKDTAVACHEIEFPKDEMNRIAEAGDLAFQANLAKSSNPYRSPNAQHENTLFANYWDRGFSVGEKRQRVKKS